MAKLTEDQIMGMMSPQKFYVATENGVESYCFVAMNPKTATPLVVAIPTSDYGRAVVLRINGKAEFYLDYNEARLAFIAFAEEKINWWKNTVEEDEQKTK
jgi:hypothetical protein